MREPGYLRGVLRFLRNVALVDLCLLAAVALVCWLLGAFTANNYGSVNGKTYIHLPPGHYTWSADIPGVRRLEGAVDIVEGQYSTQSFSPHLLRSSKRKEDQDGEKQKDPPTRQ